MVYFQLPQYLHPTVMFFITPLVPAVSIFKSSFIWNIMLFGNVIISLSIFESTLFFLFTKHQIFFHWPLIINMNFFPGSWRKNICSYRHQITGLCHIININTSHFFCMILWLYSHLSFIFVVKNIMNLEILIHFLLLYKPRKRKPVLSKRIIMK